MAGPGGEPPVDRVSRRTGETLGWLFLVSAVLTGYEVAASALFRSPTIWVHDLTTMLCVVCFLLGGAYALQRREHIRITPIYDLLPARARHGLDILGHLLTLFYLAVLAWFTGAQALESVRIWELSGHAWDFPMPVVIRVAFFLGTLLLLLQAASHLQELLARPAGRRP